MKRIITTLMMVLGFVFTAMAQSAQFYYKGSPLAEGASIIVEAEEDDWGDLNCETNPAGSKDNGLILKNLTSDEIKGVATLTINTNTLSPSRIQWCMGGQCVQIKETPYNKDFVVPASGYIQVQFDAIPTVFGELEAEIKARIGLKNTTVKVKFVNKDPNAKPAFTRRAVVEEFTGTWCGNCPRGIVALQRLAQDFGDRVICIAVHQGSEEPMQIATYPELVPGTGGVPACMVNRGPKLDPYSGSGTNGYYHYGIDADVEAALNEPAEAGIELTAQWNDANLWDVRFTTTTTFGIDSNDAPYRLAFVLLEDGLKGEGKNWVQKNYFSTASGFDDSKNYSDDDMKFWRDAAYEVKDMEYNHVAVQTLGIKNGINGSISSPIVKDKPQTFSQLVTTLNVKVIQDKSRLSAVALLINTSTGSIVNAAKTAILPYGTDGIKAIDGEKRMTDNSVMYDLQGRMIQSSKLNAHSSKLPKGIYIRDGRKFVVR